MTRVVTVTRAQRTVVGELARDGADNATIARRLNITEHTVKTHVKNLLAATGCPNRTALVCGLLRGEIRLRTVANRRLDVEEAA